MSLRQISIFEFQTRNVIKIKQRWIEDISK